MKGIILQGLSIDEFKDIISNILNNTIIKKLSNPKKEDLSEFLTRKQVAEMLKISLTTLNQYSKQGIIQAHRVGKRILYKLNEVENSVIQVKNLKYKRGC